MTTICLRPVAVWDEGRYAAVRARWAERPESEWEPCWEYGAFVDVRDVAAACVAALACPDPGHARLLLCADDVAATVPGRALARRLLPSVEWRGGPEYDADPWRTLVDTSRAREVLGWAPRVRFADSVRD